MVSSLKYQEYTHLRIVSERSNPCGSLHGCLAKTHATKDLLDKHLAMPKAERCLRSYTTNVLAGRSGGFPKKQTPGGSKGAWRSPCCQFEHLDLSGVGFCAGCGL